MWRNQYRWGFNGRRKSGGYSRDMNFPTTVGPIWAWNQRLWDVEASIICGHQYFMSFLTTPTFISMVIEPKTSSAFYVPVHVPLTGSNECVFFFFPPRNMGIPPVDHEPPRKTIGKWWFHGVLMGFTIVMFHYQRVNPIKPPFNHHFPRVFHG